MKGPKRPPVDSIPSHDPSTNVNPITAGRISKGIFVILAVLTLSTELWENDFSCTLIKGLGKNSSKILGSSRYEASTLSPPPSSSSCDRSLHQLVVDMAKFTSPPYILPSGGINRTKRILENAQQFHIAVALSDFVFGNIMDNMGTALEAYGLTRVKNAVKRGDCSIFNSDTMDFADDQSVILVHAPVRRNRGCVPGCNGTRCKNMPQILIQTDPIGSKRGNAIRDSAIRECQNERSNCVVWEYCHSNIVKLTQQGLGDAVMFMPTMFHDSFQKHYPPKVLSPFSMPSLIRNSTHRQSIGGSIHQSHHLIPYKNRKTGFAFFGTMTPRRKAFKIKYLTRSSNLTKLPFQYGRNRDRKDLARRYQDTRICLILHSQMTDSGAEYHRLSDVKRFGCIPIMETLYHGNGTQPPPTNVLNKCAGMIFADFDDLPAAIMSELDRIESTPNQTLLEQQTAIDRWWEDGIHWDILLRDIFGPKRQSV